MSFEAVKEYLEKIDATKKILEFEHSTATVSEAAQAIGCIADRIAKTLSFFVDGNAILIVASGMSKIDNSKFKAEFSQKAKMIPYDEVQDHIGHAPGGVCPFAVKQDVAVYADVSLKKYETFYPAAGNSNSAVEMSSAELEKFAQIKKWIDVCKVAE